MKKQTYIVKIYDGNGKMVDFERFTYKKVASVANAMTQLYNNSLYRVCSKNNKYFDIIETPNGIDETEIKESYIITYDHNGDCKLIKK